MDQVARLSIEDRRALFTETAARAGITALIAEKDFWVCWTLRRLYGIESMPRLLFKGCTSLSKCFGLIERFSEDIDLGLKREDMELGADADPASKSSRSGYQTAVKVLIPRVQTYVEETLVPKIRTDFDGVLIEAFEIPFERVASESVIHFRYPRGLDASTYVGDDPYIRPEVRLEVGGRSDHYPTREVAIQSYTADHFPGEFIEPSCMVVAQAPERTLLEKALIFHRNIAKGKFPEHSSRHAYDLMKLHRDTETMENVTYALFEQVAEHKFKFSDDNRARRAPEEGIRMVPEGDLLRDLASDYRSMEEMFFRDPPPFEEIVEELRALETAINALVGQS